MDWLGKLEGIVAILGTLTVGGVIGSIISLWYKSRHENAKAGQEEAKVEQESAKADLQEEQVRQLKFSTTKEAISVWERTIEVLKQEKEADRTSFERDRAEWAGKLEDLSQKIMALTVQVENQKTELKEKDEAMANMTRAQLKLKLELDLMKASMVDSCESCSFKHACDKYSAKCLMSEDETK